ncbi:MAG: hypothetical protein KC613_12120 [Myxococcales bacterium]|nr:hypothetical protein [Myxococcales bacterium]MCB9526103.1 hypothetical protein [Myxococcales bacterium]
MGPPLIIGAATLALTWTLLLLGLPQVAGVALVFGALAQVGWLLDDFGGAGVTLLACLALSPPGVAFGAGLLDGWHAEPSAEAAAHDLPGAALTVGPYRVGRALTSAPPVRLR